MLSAREFKAAARMPYAWLGGYPRVILMEDGESLCVPCARDNAREILTEIHSVARYGFASGDAGWIPAEVFINWEDESLYCAHCYRRIESAYENA